MTRVRRQQRLEPTDTELVKRAQAGEEQALTLLVNRHAPRLYELAAMMIGQASDAQDIVQETLLAMWRQLPRFEARSTFRTWVIGILIRQTARHRRKRAARRMMAWVFPARDDARDSRGMEPASENRAVAQMEARLDLLHHLAKLPEDQRVILLLREIEGLSYAQMADLLKLPAGTVESRLHRARVALRERVGLGDQP